MLRPRTLLATLPLAFLAAPVASLRAQVVMHPVLASEAVKKAIAGAEAEARKNGWQVSIAVVDPAGNLLGFLKLDDASPGSVDIAQAKARTAARGRRTTKAYEDIVAGGRTALLSMPGIVAVEGGVPLLIDGKVVAAVGVSGATSPQDAQVATAGIVAAGGSPPPPPAPPR